jgi:hypothetical protein
MNSTTTYEQTDYRHRPETSDRADTRGIGGHILQWLGRVGERSGMARRAETFARLNALSDDELAARGLYREELLVRCFGGRVLF